MENYSFIFAKAALLILAAVLFVEYVILRQELNRVLVQNCRNQQQPAAYPTELKDLYKELGRRTESAEKLPQFTRKFTEMLPPGG